MRIERVMLSNIRCFEKLMLEFGSGFNVIIGRNGVGKSTILSILARILNVYANGQKFSMTDKDARETLVVQNDQYLIHASDQYFIDSNIFGFSRNNRVAIHSLLRTVDMQILSIYNNNYLRSADQDPSIPLPLIAFFSPWREAPRRSAPTSRHPGPKRRTEGYAGALDLKSDFTAFAAWFKAMEQERMDGGRPVPSVEAIRAVLVRCLPDATDVRYYPGINDIYVTFKDGRREPLWRMSDGYRTMVAILGELAFRAVTLNPTLGAEVAAQVEGVVLIDELDLHLHPDWQRRVVMDLQAAFPRVQFIATTHSPFIVQAVDGEQCRVINLSGDPVTERTGRMSPEDITEKIMGVPLPQRSERWRRMYDAAAAFFERLDHLPAADPERQRALEELDALSEPFSDDPAFAAFLARKRRLVVQTAGRDDASG